VPITKFCVGFSSIIAVKSTKVMTIAVLSLLPSSGVPFPSSSVVMMSSSAVMVSSSFPQEVFFLETNLDYKRS